MKLLYLSEGAVCAAICACFVGCASDGDGPDVPVNGRTVTVLEYNPAPGQFVNEIPEYTEGDTYETILGKVQRHIDCGELVSLGAFGGSITFAVNPPIKTRPDGKEFRVLGNAFVNGQTDGGWYGSSEPGVIQVMEDVNGNGRPDDGEWCTITPDCAVSGVLTVTYTRHAEGDDNNHYIAWCASDGTSGWLNRVEAYHRGELFPGWLPAGVHTVTVSGLCLADNAVYDEPTKTWRLFAVPNTADSYANNDDRSLVSISSARRSDGSAAALESVSFIRVHTGVLKCNGILGEESTEVAGIEVRDAG